MAHLSLRVLGSLQVLIDGVPVTSFESDKARALLAYLAVEAGHSHRRDTLIGLLWPDYPEQDARHSLRQALFNLRLALGDHTAKPSYLLITRDAIQFNRESDYSLDLAQFHNGYDAWERKRNQAGEDDRGDEGDTILLDTLKEMVELYCGEFLQQFSLEDSAPFEEWKLVQREKIHQQVMDALAYLTDTRDCEGDYRAARRYAERQLELDPWREEAHRQLIRALALDGQRSAALAQYETCQRVLREELGMDPSPLTVELCEQIRLGTLTNEVHLQRSAPSIVLPLPLTPFIGRERELAELGEMITDPQCRCLSLVGPGGIGKTRLALQIAGQHASRFAHGVAFIPLASAGSVEAVIPAIANAIRFDFYGPSDPKVQLLNHLCDKQMLLVVDNVEHLLVEEPQSGTILNGTIAELLVEILQQAARVRLLVTSREALNLQGEWLFEIRGLPFPAVEQTDGCDEYSAVALFVQRARRSLPGFEMNAEDTRGVILICRLVEGMPLAIELAASWVRLLSPAEIAAEIEHSLDFLNGQMRDLPERHRSMRAVFDHSWQTLSSQEKQVLSRLSIFRGAFSRQAAERVAGATLSVLSSLVNRSLLRRITNEVDTSSGRYDLHELVQQYAGMKLAEERDVLQVVQERHCLYYLGLLAEKDAELHSQHQKRVLTELTGEIDNIRAAWNWAIGEHKFEALYQASTALWYLFELRNWFKEGERLFWNAASALRASISEPDADFIHQVALDAMLAHCGYFRFRLGRGEEAYGMMASGAASFQKSDDSSATIYSSGYLGIICWQLGRFDEAKARLQEGLTIARKCGDRWYEALAGEFLGSLAREEGAYSHAEQYSQESLSIFRQLGDPMMISHGLTDLGRTMFILGNFPEAEKLLGESLSIARELECQFGIGAALDVLGQVANAGACYADAQAFFSESASLFTEIGDTYRLAEVLNHQGLNALSLKDFIEAEKAFRSALKLARDGGLIPSVLNALTGLASIEIDQNPGAGTLELVNAILLHPASTQEAKNLALKLRVELAAKLTPQEITTTLEQAEAKNLTELIYRILK